MGAGSRWELRLISTWELRFERLGSFGMWTAQINFKYAKASQLLTSFAQLCQHGPALHSSAWSQMVPQKHQPWLVWQSSLWVFCVWKLNAGVLELSTRVASARVSVQARVSVRIRTWLSRCGSISTSLGATTICLVWVSEPHLPVSTASVLHPIFLCVPLCILMCWSHLLVCASTSVHTRLSHSIVGWPSD